MRLSAFPREFYEEEVMWSSIKHRLLDPPVPHVGGFQMNLKVFVFALLATAVTDVLNTGYLFQKETASLVGVLCGVLVQQVIPPRLTLARLLFCMLAAVLIVLAVYAAGERVSTISQ